MQQYLEHYTASVEVQFSGNAKSYHYLCNAAQWVVISHHLRDKLDTRVVTPGKIKDDRLSLSIANVVGCQPSAHPEAVHAIVEVLPPLGIEIAKTTVLRAEQKASA